MPTKHRRNVISLSDIPVELEDWAKEQAARRKSLGLPRAAYYQIYVDGLRLLKERVQFGEKVFYLSDGRGPFYSTLECLDALGVPDEGRGLYWHRLDRLPQEYAEQIEVREHEPEEALAV